MDNKVIFVFFYDEYNEETILFNKLLELDNLDKKIKYIPCGDISTKTWLTNNKNNIHISKFPCVVKFNDNKYPKIYNINEIDTIKKEINSLIY